MPEPTQAAPQTAGHKPLGMPFIELKSVDSTNNYARRLLDAGLAQHGHAFFAHEQLSGKGQRGKGWVSKPGSNIIISIVVDPAPLVVSRQFQLNASLTLGVHEFLTKYAGNEIKIKWPNDLYWHDRKAGGMLIESKLGDNWRWAIVGIGVNINQTEFPSTLPNPVSLKQITGRDFDPVILAKQLCVDLDKYLRLLIADGFDTIYARYQECLYKKDEKVRLRKDNRVFETTIKGVSVDGQLIAQHLIEERFDFGEIEWIID